MTKIAIISRPEQGVLIDIGGCTTVNEATQHLSQTLQGAGQFWEDQPVDLNMGSLSLSAEEVAQVQAIFSESGVRPRNYFSQVETTRAALQAHKIEPCNQAPATLSPAARNQDKASPSAIADNNAGKDEQSWTIDSPPAAKDDTAPSTKAPAAGEAATASNTAPDPASNTTGDTSNGSDSASPPQESSETASDAAQTPAPAVTVPAAPHVLYVRQTLRSGQAVSHKGHLVIVGDVNPGAEVMAEGDITVWGALRGMAHAGTAGNTRSEIRALKFDPIQLRIAHAIARAPDRPRGALQSNGPETARIVNGIIRISSSTPD